MDVTDLLESLGLFRFDSDALEAIDEEVAAVPVENPQVRRDLLALASAEVEAIHAFLARGDIPTFPLERPITVTRDAAAIATKEADCTGWTCFAAERPEELEPNQIAVMGGDAAKLAIAGRTVGISNWAEADAEGVRVAMSTIGEQWREQGQDVHANKIELVRIQQLLWAAKIERLVRPDTFEESVTEMAAELNSED